MSLLTLLVILGGCATVERAREAQDPSKAVPGERTPSAAEMGVPVKGPITLGEVERTTLRANPAIVEALHNLESARARVGEAQSAYYPQFSTGSVASFRLATQNSAGFPGPQENSSVGSTTFGFNVSWLIFDFGRTPAEVRQAAKQELAAEQNYRSAQVNTLFNARAAFFNLEKQRELLEVARETVRQFETRLDQVRLFVQVGRRGFTRYDETKASVDLSNARLTEIQTRDALRLAQAELANAMGLAERTEWVAVTTTALPPVPADFDSAWAIAREQQPALAAARAQEEAASAVVDAQVAALYPAISAGAGISTSTVGVMNPFTWNWSLGPSLSWTLFNGFANLYAIDDAAANLRAVRAQRTAIEQQVWLDVWNTYIALEDARERLNLTALTIDQALENLELARGRYDVGTASAVDLTDAQVGLAQARGNHAQARADYDTALANLWKALGRTTWTEVTQ